MTGILRALRTTAFQRCFRLSLMFSESISARYPVRALTKSSESFSSAAFALNPGSLQPGTVPPSIWFPSSMMSLVRFTVSTIDETRHLFMPRAVASFSWHEFSAAAIASFIALLVSTRAENFAACLSKTCATSADVLHSLSSWTISGCRFDIKDPWERGVPPSATFSGLHIAANFSPIALSTNS